MDLNRRGIVLDIMKAYQDSDKLRYYVICPHFSHNQTLEWSMLVLDEKQPETVTIRCKEWKRINQKTNSVNQSKKSEW